MAMRAVTINDIGTHVANGFEHVTMPLGADYTLDVKVKEDPYESPNNADCYSAEDVARFKAGDWRYIGLVVKVIDSNYNNVGTVSLWSIEYGLGDVSGYLTDQVADLVDDLAGSVESTELAEMLRRARHPLVASTLGSQIYCARCGHGGCED